MARFSKQNLFSPILVVTLTIAAFFPPLTAHAACSSPNANIGALDFQSSVFKYCDGNNWLNLGATPTFPLAAPNGTNAAPSYSFTNSTNTGMYLVAAATLAFATGGTQRIVVDSSGRVGIGTFAMTSTLAVRNPNDGSSTALSLDSGDPSWVTDQELRQDFSQLGTSLARIASTYWGGTDWGLNFYGFNSGSLNTTPVMTMRGTGNVGIGTNAPAEKLDVRGTHVTLKNDGSTVISAESFDGSNYPRITVTRGGCGGSGFCNALNSETLGQFDFSTKNQAQVGAIIRGVAGENQNDSRWGSNLQILTVGTLTTTAVERMTILHNGNVGIGTTSPSSKLHVEGAIKMVDGNQGADRIMASDANGVGSWTQFPKFSAKRTANQSISGGSDVKVQLNLEDFDTTSAFDSTTNYRYLPLVAGYYQFTGTIHNADGCRSAMYSAAVLYLNGAILKSSGVYLGTGYMMPTQVTHMIYMNGTSDYVELYASHNCGSARNYIGSLQGRRVP